MVSDLLELSLGEFGAGAFFEELLELYSSALVVVEIPRRRLGW